MEKKILVTCECAPNIALVKYWGKKNEDLIIPLNSSLSITLDKNVLKTKTSVMLIKKNKDFSGKDVKIWFDKVLVEFNEADENLSDDVINTKRFLRVLNKIRSNSKLENQRSYAIRICTYNTFPTACGLASSASGNACMALALAHAFDYRDDISELARLGSGSACRSCYGGFVKWCGTNEDKSIAVQVFKSTHWQEMNVLILVLNDQQKEVSSTKGMKTSVATSELLKERVKLVESSRIPLVEEAIATKNFQKLAELIMRDSNQFHAICLDSYPPLFYLNQKSQEIINIINAFNNYPTNELKAAYSFDAGPNAFIFIQDEYLSEFLQLLRFFYFENLNIETFLKEKFASNLDFDEKCSLFEENSDCNEKKVEYFKKFNLNQSKSNEFIKFIMHSKIGDEPTIQVHDNVENSLLNTIGEPKDSGDLIDDSFQPKRIKLDGEAFTNKQTVFKNNLNRKFERKFNIYVVEDHNDALEKIYKEIGSKFIQFNDITLIHFDSHPDLGLNRALNDDLVFNKDLLYSNLSIENWILPACYAGHINKIVWVKPKWSNQIKSGKYEFFIGRDKNNGYIRVSSKLTYFLTELVYTHVDNLVNKKFITLYVVDFNDLLTLNDGNSSFKNEIFVLLEEKSSQSKLKDIIVDIDLDFFSTLDPFKELFQTDYAYSIFKKLYYLPTPVNDENFEGNYEIYKVKKQEHMNRILGYLTNSSIDDKVDEEFYGLMKEYSGIVRNASLNVDILHNYGEGIDEAGLPHHKTSNEELRPMFESIEQFLQQFFIDINLIPGLITIARSSLDDYCPLDQVDFIQNEVITRLKLIFDISINSIVYDYESN